MKYLLWFLAMLVFYLVFIPSYSIARLHDTTWGKGNNAADEAAGNKEKRDQQKKAVRWVNVMLVIFNYLLSWGFCRSSGETRIYFMFALFVPVFIQISFSLMFLFVLNPARAFFYPERGVRAQIQQKMLEDLATLSTCNQRRTATSDITVQPTAEGKKEEKVTAADRRVIVPSHIMINNRANYNSYSLVGDNTLSPIIEMTDMQTDTDDSRI